MITYKDGDVLKHKCDKPTVLIHVNNDRGGWGSGFVVPLGKKYPKVEHMYRDWYSVTETDLFIDHTDDGNDDNDTVAPFVLGQIQVNRVEDNLYIVNMIAQSQPGGCRIKIGDESVHLRPLRLECLKECLLRVASFAKSINAEVIGPMFGSALAGGDWDNEIVPLIEECICKYNIPVTIYRFK